MYSFHLKINFLGKILTKNNNFMVSIIKIQLMG